MYRKGLSSRANKISSMIASTDNSGPGSTGQDSVPTAGTHGIRKNVFRRMPALIPKKSQSRFSSMVIHPRPFPFFTRLELINAIDEYFFTNINGAWRKFGDIASWDVSRITDMSLLFANAAAGGNDTIANLTENKLAGISNWNVSSVTTMTATFKGSKFNGDLSKWNVSKVTDFSSMFASSLIANDTMLKWDVRAGTDFSTMFSSASNFTTNLSYWNVKSDATLTDMFLGIFDNISGSVKPASTPLYSFFNKITFLTGDEAITHERTQQFIDPGATTVTGEIPFVFSFNVGTDTSGTYTIIYKATNPRGASGTITRIVTIVDTTAPVITLTGSSTVILERGDTYVDLGATSSEGQAVTNDSATTINNITVGTYTITYTTTDDNANTSTATRTVEVVDTIPPVITSGTTGIDLVDATEAGQTVYTITATNIGETTYAIGGTDASLLNVNSSTGVVTLNDIPAYDTKSSYSFTVTSSDDGGNITAPITVTFSITQAV
jgi:surface protein